MEIIQKVCNGKTDDTNEKVVKAYKNQSNSDSNTNTKNLIFVCFLSKID